MSTIYLINLSLSRKILSVLDVKSRNLPECDAVYSIKNSGTFRRKIPPPSSLSKSKPTEKEARSKPSAARFLLVACLT
jgi:hypothetical protein